MSIQKLENYNNKSAIQEEVMILTDTLKDVAKQLKANKNNEFRKKPLTRLSPWLIYQQKITIKNS